MIDASPLENDNKRGFTAQQWARLCGRNFCSDAIGEIVRHRNVIKTTSCKMSKRDLLTKERVVFKSSVPLRSSSTKVDGNILYFSIELHCNINISSLKQV